MNQIDIDSKQAVSMALVDGALLLDTIPGLSYMEEYARRFGANMMLPCFFVGLVLIGISYQLSAVVNPQLGSCLIGVVLYSGFFGSYAFLTCILLFQPTRLIRNGKYRRQPRLLQRFVIYFFKKP